MGKSTRVTIWLPPPAKKPLTKVVVGDNNQHQWFVGDDLHRTQIPVPLLVRFLVGLLAYP